MRTALSTCLGTGRRAAYLRDTLVLCGVAWLLRVVVVLAYGAVVPPAADGAFYDVVAQRIAMGQGYTWAWPDGAVTFAAHFPVGYAALLGAVYALGSHDPMLGMLLNALLGAVAVVATHRLALRVAGRVGAALAAAFVAFSPTLVGYTLALMTEGAVASGWIVATWLAVRAAEVDGAARSQRGHALAAALVLGATSLLRPQSLLLGPVLGWIAAGGARSAGSRLAGARSALLRGASAAAVSAIALAVCLPWTARNCVRMDRCVLVSANGGWNLLIGTFPEGAGSFVPIAGNRVPEDCREVFGEADKDACFGAAARQRIAAAPTTWLGLVPAKWRSTFDFTASASAYLAEAGAPWSEARRDALRSLEVGWRRLLVALALLGAWRLGQSAAHGVAWRNRLRTGLVVVGCVCLLFEAAWVSHVLLVALFATVGRLHERPVALAAAGALLGTLAVHAVFFGAGRYSMVLEPFLGVVAAANLGARRETDLGVVFDSRRATG